MRLRNILLIQSVYYFLTGIWPVLHMQSFIAVSGPKTDLWLVKMVGLLTTSIAVALFYSSRTHPGTGLVLGMASAFAFTGVDLYYALGEVIPGIYLLDAVAEFIIITLLLITRNRI